MLINANTKIAAILKHEPLALDVITGMSPKFEKLRNPLLRKLLAGRTSLDAASKMGGCTVQDFFSRLEPLGFEIDRQEIKPSSGKKPVPSFMNHLNKESMIDLDVRPILNSGRDPLNIIMQTVKSVRPGQVLRIINTFEPTPLILLLEKKGFLSYVVRENEEQTDSYFYNSEGSANHLKTEAVVTGNWNECVLAYTGKMVELDVRHLEMPGPMMAIMESLEHLPENHALYIYHKRIPVFLLPELVQRNFEYRINELNEGHVHLIVFRK